MKCLYCLLLLCTFAQYATADTIDFWHVYCGGRNIGRFNDYATNDTIILKFDNVKSTDSITVRFFRDTPCFECRTFLLADDAHQKRVATGSGRGTFSQLSIAVKDLVADKSDGRNTTYIFYFHEESTMPPDRKKRLFSLKFM